MHYTTLQLQRQPQLQLQLQPQLQLHVQLQLQQSECTLHYTRLPYATLHSLPPQLQLQMRYTNYTGTNRSRANTSTFHLFRIQGSWTGRQLLQELATPVNLQSCGTSDEHRWRLPTSLPDLPRNQSRKFPALPSYPVQQLQVPLAAKDWIGTGGVSKQNRFRGGSNGEIPKLLKQIQKRIF